MSDTVEWRTIFGRLTLFVGSVGIGDCYPSKGADGTVWRLRIWRPGRLQGGFEALILSGGGEETAKQELLELLEQAKQERGE